MTFGTKLTNRIGKDEIVEISLANIQDQIVALLYATKRIKDYQDVLSLDLGDIIGKKRTDVVRIGIKVRKE